MFKVLLPKPNELKIHIESNNQFKHKVGLQDILFVVWFLLVSKSIP